MVPVWWSCCDSRYYIYTFFVLGLSRPAVISMLSPSYGVVSGGTPILVVVAVLCDVPGTDSVGRLCVIFRDVRSDPLLLGDSSFWYWFLMTILLWFLLLHLHVLRTGFVATCSYLRVVSVLRCGYWGGGGAPSISCCCDVVWCAWDGRRWVTVCGTLRCVQIRCYWVTVYGLP
jgi:hypothetical protein